MPMIDCTVALSGRVEISEATANPIAPIVASYISDLE